jgi:aspartyl-tRNA(Asn)/glutamyl-tRNA(Gln) amidotransferase subunit C
MSLTLKDVEHIAQLARLKLSAGQMEHYRGQLSSILDHIAKLQQLDTRDVPPTTGGGFASASMPLRADEARPGLDLETLMKNAPEKLDDQFKVPPVFE